MTLNSIFLLPEYHKWGILHSTFGCHEKGCFKTGLTSVETALIVDLADLIQFYQSQHLSLTSLDHFRKIGASL